MAVHAIMMQVDAFHFIGHRVCDNPCRKGGVRFSKQSDVLAPGLFRHPVHQSQSIHTFVHIRFINSFRTTFASAILDDVGNASTGIGSSVGISISSAGKGIGRAGDHYGPRAILCRFIEAGFEPESIATLQHLFLKYIVAAGSHNFGGIYFPRSHRMTHHLSQFA